MQASPFANKIFFYTIADYFVRFTLEWNLIGCIEAVPKISYSQDSLVLFIHTESLMLAVSQQRSTLYVEDDN
jgi:hypothetical protein